MDKDYCRLADEEMLVEAYVAGKLKGEVLKKFEEHLKICVKHARAVSLEKALKKGIAEYARAEIKLRIRNSLEKMRDKRFLLLRYAAILFVAVLMPLLLHYQFNIATYDFSSKQTGETDKAAKREIVPAEIPDTSPAPRPDEKKQQKIPEKKEKTETRTGAQADGRVTSQADKGPAPSADSRDKLFENKSVVGHDELEMAVPYPSASERTSDAALNKIQTAGKLHEASISLASGLLKTELDQKAISDSSRIRTCIRNNLPFDNWSGYRVSSLLQIYENGEIRVIGIQSAAFRSDVLEACLKEVMNSWIVGPGKTEQIVFEIQYLTAPSSP
jgi:hypothetical protein